MQALQSVIEEALQEVCQAEEGEAGLDVSGSKDWAQGLNGMKRGSLPTSTDTATSKWADAASAKLPAHSHHEGLFGYQVFRSALSHLAITVDTTGASVEAFIGRSEHEGSLEASALVDPDTIRIIGSFILHAKVRPHS